MNAKDKEKYELMNKRFDVFCDRVMEFRDNYDIDILKGFITLYGKPTLDHRMIWETLLNFDIEERLENYAYTKTNAKSRQ
jgi:hypothetical protein